MTSPANAISPTHASLALANVASFWNALARGDADTLELFLTPSFRRRLRARRGEFPASLYAALDATPPECQDVAIPDVIWLLDDDRVAVACTLALSDRRRNERWVVLARDGSSWQIDGTERPPEDRLIGTMTFRAPWARPWP